MNEKYDIAIIGGGIAGLCLSIDIKKRGYTTVVIEKGEYPRHKVCGEYISMESRDYLQNLCPVLSELNLPSINNFKLTSGRRKEFSTGLEYGGFGISRYLLEQLLFDEAKKQGVKFILNTKARYINIDTENSDYSIKTNSEDIISASLVCNSTGRKSNLKNSTRINKYNNINYIGVKYHVKISRDPGLIEIHNFPGGYCGISNIEENKSCVCYIVNAEKLKKAKNSISELENIFLFKNINLKKIFSEAEFLFKEPLTISGIDFHAKQPVANNSFFLGDSAGSIAPITGNGMSMGLKSAFVLASNVDQYLSKRITKQELKNNYSYFWNNEFSTRIKLSRYFQKLSEYPFLTKRTIELFNLFPSMAKNIIKQTHGNPF